MHALSAAATSSAWNAGGSILTFYFPVGLFVVIGALLWVQLSRPHAVPGRRPFALEKPRPDGVAGEPDPPEADG